MEQNKLNFALSQQDYSLKDGLTLLTSMYKGVYIQRESGVSRNYLVMATRGYQLGTLRRFPDRYVDQLNETIIRIGQQLMQTRITEDDTLAQLKTLAEKIPLQNIFANYLGWSEGKLKQRLYAKSGNMYGKFEPDTINKVNEALAAMAMKTLMIHLVYAEQENTPKSEESATAVQESCKKTD